MSDYERERRLQPYTGQGQDDYAASIALDLKVAWIAARKRAGIDCDQDESAAVKRYFDRYTSEAEAERDAWASLFPLEYAEWCEEDRT